MRNLPFCAICAGPGLVPNPFLSRLELYSIRWTRKAVRTTTLRSDETFLDCVRRPETIRSASKLVCVARAPDEHSDGDGCEAVQGRRHLESADPHKRSQTPKAIEVRNSSVGYLQDDCTMVRLSA